MATISPTKLASQIEASFQNAETIGQLLSEELEIVPEIYKHLGSLSLLHDVPINYLVPDEGMLPPESIRFFYLDYNWISALLDGAFSIGRNLSTGSSACNSDLPMDATLMTKIKGEVSGYTKKKRLDLFGLEPEDIGQDGTAYPTQITGFLLRSKLVQEYPNIGVNAYASKADLPTLSSGSPNPNAKMMPILRFERLGPGSDTLLCLLDGPLYRVDIHEAPELLHYGIDSYSDDSGTITATKGLLPLSFTQITVGKKATSYNISIPNDTATPVDIHQSFRSGDPRTLDIASLSAPNTLSSTSLAGTVKTALNIPGAYSDAFDSATFGMAMTEGVGLVKFVNEDDFTNCEPNK